MSVSAAWPSVIAAVYALSDTLADVRVTRGRDNTFDTGDYIQVGVSEIEDHGWDGAGDFDQQFQTFGGARVESGTVNVLALSRNGDADMGAASVALFALVSELTTAVRADNTLGLASTFDYIVAQVETGTVHESSNDEGAMASMTLAVKYEARF